MATKVIYFKVGENEEQAEFRSEDCTEDVRDIFRAAAEAGPSDILKLYNTSGNLVNISPKLPENTPDSRYQLNCVAVHYKGPSNSSAEGIGGNIEDIENRLNALERSILVESGHTPELVDEMKRRVEYFRDKLENVDHLSWLGLYKDISSGTALQPFWSKHANTIQYTSEHCKQIFKKFLESSQNQVCDKTRESLKKPTFDNWPWEEYEMMLLLRQMFIDLDLISKLNIEISVLNDWLCEIYKHYNNVPFHNFKHCFMVSQMMYGLIWLMNLADVLDSVDILSLLVSSICHDLDHPGYNNTYQINAGTELALRYNDVSPLENHHCSVAFRILRKPQCNICRNLQPEQFKRVRKNVITCILATDMARHKEILDNFEKIIDQFDISNSNHKDILYQILIKVGDVSNECRPTKVAEPWLQCLLEEYFAQSDVEKLEGLPVADFMDRDKVTKAKSQIGFIQFVLQPLFEALGRLYPVVVNDIVVPVRDAYQHYVNIQREETRLVPKEKELDKLKGKITPSLANGLDTDRLSNPSKQTGAAH